MPALPKINQQIKTQSGPATVAGLIGQGATGAVFRLTRAADTMALKWYYPASATPKLKDTLRSLAAIKPAPDRVIWPIELLDGAACGVGGFGIVTSLRDARFRCLDDLLLSRTSPSLRTSITAGLNLVRCFRSIHDRGLVITDISGSDVCIDPANGDVVLANSDGFAQSTGDSPWPAGWRFDAPDRIAGSTGPTAARGSVENDRFILAELLFGLLVRLHPFEGRLWFELPPLQAEPLRKLYAEPLFVFAEDDSNRPDGKEFGQSIRRWENLPHFARDAFSEAFGPGLTSPTAWLDEATWERHLQTLRDCIAACPKDPAENFVPFSSGAFGEIACRVCGHSFKPAMWIDFGEQKRVGDAPIASHTVVVADNATLHARHLSPAGDDAVVAIVNRHPKQPDLIGLKNLSGKPWNAILADGRKVTVEPGRNVSLAVGVQIDFGGAACVLRNQPAPEAKPPEAPSVPPEEQATLDQVISDALSDTAAGDANRVFSDGEPIVPDANSDPAAAAAETPDSTPVDDSRKQDQPA